MVCFGVGLEQLFNLTVVSAKTIRRGKLIDLVSTGASNSRLIGSKFRERSGVISAKF
jgi:hypothetical protein